MKSKGGFIVLVVLGLLGILAFLAISLSFSSQSSKTLSVSALNKTRARLLARSGVEKLWPHLNKFITVENNIDFEKNPRFAGEDRNRDGEVGLNEEPLGNGNLLGEIGDAPLEDALCPSLAYEDPNSPGQALLITINEKQRGLTWRDNQNGITRLKVVENNNLIDLNAGIVEGDAKADRTDFDNTFALNWSANDPDHPYNRPMVNFLNALGNYYRYISHDGILEPDETYQWDMPEIGNNPVTIDNVRNLSGNINAKFYGSHLDYPANGSTEGLGLGNFIIDKRPEVGFQSLHEIEPLAKQWARDNDLFAGFFWSKVSDLITLFSQKRKSTQIYRQELLTPLNSGRGDQPDQAELYKDLGIQGENGTRAWLTARGFKHPRPVVNLNTAPLPILAALIYAVKDVQYRHVSYDNTYTLTRPLLMANYEFINKDTSLGGDPLGGRVRIRENHFPFTSPFEAIQYAGPNFNLFSMTESIQLAKMIIDHRAEKPFTSYQEFYDFLVEFPYGFDAKAEGCEDHGDDTHPNGASFYGATIYFHDLFTYNERERLLWTILNPNGNLRHFVFDEALPLTTLCKEFRYAHPEKNFFAINGNPSQGERYSFRGGAYGQIDFDKSYPHEFAGEVSFLNEGNLQVESEGLILNADGKVLAQSKILTVLKPYGTIHLTTQKDFAQALDTGNATTFQHNALVGDWVTYPELPQAQELSTLDGQLALVPLTDDSHPYLFNIKSNHSFNPFQQYLTNEHPTEQRISGGPELLTKADPFPSSGTKVSFDTDQDEHIQANVNEKKTEYITPWQPEPGGNLNDVPLLAASTNLPDLDGTNHLFPGGGFYPDAQASTPVEGLVEGAGFGVNFSQEKFGSRRLGGLVLDAKQSANQYVIGNLISASFNSTEGAVSFFFKPRHYPLAPYAVVDAVDEKFRKHDRTPYCLFDYHFFISDRQNEQNIASELSFAGIINPLPEADLYRCNIRLLYGGMWSAYPEDSPTNGPKKEGVFNLFPLNGELVPHHNGSTLTQWVRDPSTSQLISALTNPGFGFLFEDMNGLPVPSSGADYTSTLSTGGGYLTQGELSAHRQDNPNYHKYVSDKLWLEFRITQVIESYGEYDTNASPYKRRILLGDPENPAYVVGPTPFPNNSLRIYESFALGPLPNDPLKNFFYGEILPPFLSDTSFNKRTSGSHTIVKSFRLDYPIVLDPTDPSFASGPEDPENNPQAMINHGRWHHFVIAWRNIRNLLDINGINHKGGSVALYHNGTFKKDVTTQSSLWPYRGMFWLTDFFPGFWETRPDPTNSAITIGTVYPTNHLTDVGTPSYGDSGFADKPMDLFQPTLSRALPAGGPTDFLEYLPFNFNSSGEKRALKGFGMEANNDYYPREEVRILGLLDEDAIKNYWMGSTAHYAGLQFFKTDNFRPNDISSNMVYASNRFFFGAAPHCFNAWDYDLTSIQGRPPLSHKYIADGTFMDIRMADNANILYSASGNTLSGGFLPDIPNYDISPYPTQSSAGRLYPFVSPLDPGSKKLLAIHWSAYLPPFHKFWDDTNSVSDVWNEVTQDYDTNVPNTPGPDKDDQVSLALNVEFTQDGGSTWQKVDTNNLDEDLYLEQAQPLKENKNFHIFSEPEPLPNDRSISLNLLYERTVPTGSTAISPSTPLIDDLTLYHTAEQGVQVVFWQHD